MNRGAPVGSSVDEPAVRRWLHDKYERLAAEEGELAASRTSYFAAIATVLITGLVVALNYFLAEPRLLALVATFLSGIGILISFIWAVLLHRTHDAHALWRQAAIELERDLPPVAGELRGSVTLRAGAQMEVDLLRPFTSHARRFSRDKAISWMDRMQPDALTEALPICFLVVWSAVLVSVWTFVRF